MLDLNRIRENPEAVKAALLKRMDDVDFTELLQWDAQRRSLIQQNEALKAERNRINKEIPSRKKAGEEKQRLSVIPVEQHAAQKALQQKYGRQREQQERRKQNSC